MEKLLAKWERLCASSRILRFVDINLRGVAQVMFQNHPLTGTLFLAAIGWGSYAAGVPQVAIAGLLAVVVATLTAQWLRVDEASLASGLYGYNGVLVGLALATFLAPGALLWVYVVLGAAVSVIAMLGIANAVKPWGVSALTFPFVLITWLLLLATYGFSGLTGTALPSGNVVTPFQPYEASPLALIDLVAGGVPEHLASIPEGERRGGAASACGAGREFARGRGIRPRRCDTSGRYSTCSRGRKPADHRWSPRIQPGPDGDRTWHSVLSAELARRGIYSAGHGVHRHRAVGSECGVDAAGHSSSYRAFRARIVAFPASAPVFRPNHHRLG